MRPAKHYPGFVFFLALAFALGLVVVLAWLLVTALGFALRAADLRLGEALALLYSH